MKKTTLIAICFATLFAFQACKSKPSSLEGFTKTEIDSTSYAFGVWIGLTAKNHDLGDLNFATINRAIQDVLKDKELKIKQEEFGQVLDQFLMKKQTVMLEKTLNEGTEFLAKNKTKEGVVELESGLQYKILEEGTGIQPTSPSDTVTVHYRGTLIDGTTEFDSSYERGEPYTTPLDRVVSGWTEAFQLFKEGTKAILYIPSNLGYGPQQAGQHIKPNSTLIFEVELIKVSPLVEPVTKK